MRREPSSELPVLSPAGLSDRFARTVRYLRVSLTDRCNYRCTYCMPAQGWPLRPRQELLTFEELLRVVKVFASLGVQRVRLTGGEPLVRRGVVALVGQIAALPEIDQVALTTNGHLLAPHAAALRAAGLTSLNVSLDTLDPSRFAEVTRGGDLATVLSGLSAARRAGFEDIKINAVILAGLTETAAIPLVERCWAEGWLPRFIEMMPIGGLSAQRTAPLAAQAIFDLIARQTPLRWEPTDAPGPRGPARYAVVTSGPSRGQRVGFIRPMSDHGFCGDCNRVRLTARGGFRPCLADDHEVSILQPLRAGASDAQLRALIRQGLGGKLEGHHLRTPTRAPMSTMTGIGG